MTIKPPPQLSNQISIIHKLCDLYKLFHIYLKVFPKQEKYTIGNLIETTILETIKDTLAASYRSAGYKKELLFGASDKIDFLKILVRLVHDTRSLNDSKYIILEERIIELGKMFGGWIKNSS